jgi:hypothetical protein
MFNDIVIFPGGEMARGENYYRTAALVFDHLTSKSVLRHSIEKKNFN